MKKYPVCSQSEVGHDVSVRDCLLDFSSDVWKQSVVWPQDYIDEIATILWDKITKPTYSNCRYYFAYQSHLGLNTKDTWIPIFDDLIRMCHEGWDIEWYIVTRMRDRDFRKKNDKIMFRLVIKHIVDMIEHYDHEKSCIRKWYKGAGEQLVINFSKTSFADIYAA